MGQQVGSDVSNRGGWGSGEGVPLGESSVHAIEAVGMDGWMDGQMDLWMGRHHETVAKGGEPGGRSRTP